MRLVEHLERASPETEIMSCAPGAWLSAIAGLYRSMNSFSMSSNECVFTGYLALGLDAGGTIPFTR